MVPSLLVSPHAGTAAFRHRTQPSDPIFSPSTHHIGFVPRPRAPPPRALGPRPSLPNCFALPPARTPLPPPPRPTPVAANTSGVSRHPPHWLRSAPARRICCALWRPVAPCGAPRWLRSAPAHPSPPRPRMPAPWTGARLPTGMVTNLRAAKPLHATTRTEHHTNAERGSVKKNVACTPLTSRSGSSGVPPWTGSAS